MKLKVMVLSMVMLFTMSFPCFAEVRVDDSGLSDSQKAQLVQQAEKMKEDAARARAASAIPKAPTVDVVNQWVGVGEHAASAVGAFAKGMGVAGDAFLQSTTGRIIACLVVFNYGGGKLLNVMVHVALGCGLFFVFLPFWFSSMRRSGYRIYQETIMVKKPVKSKDGTTYVNEEKLVTKSNPNNEVIGWHWFTFVLFMVVSIFIAFTY